VPVFTNTERLARRRPGRAPGGRPCRDHQAARAGSRSPWRHARRT